MTLQIRNFKKHTLTLCNRYLHNPSVRNLDKMVINLRRWSHTYDKYSMEDYGYPSYDHERLRWNISYCSDRMNPGRAKAILRMMDELSLSNVRRLFRR